MNYIKKLFPQWTKNLYHLLKAVVANLYFGFPSRRIKVIGVTGTDGKTTTVQMIAKILEEAGEKIAVASTINFKVGDDEWVNETKFTTLSAWGVQAFLNRAVKENCSVVVLETSSHSLDQFRVWGVDYDTAVVTNVTREHLDYHKTMEKYRRAKRKLFEKSKTLIVNLDMENPSEFLNLPAKKRYAYSTDENKLEVHVINENCEFVLAKDVFLEMGGSEFVINEHNFKLNIPGKFNIENALAAICVAFSEDIRMDYMIRALEKIQGVPGRMEQVENDRSVDIVIDYAVTPNALKKLYELVGEIKSKREGSKIISVFGSCGDRDRGKRPIMGRIVSEMADTVIVTNEDPYTEDPQRIIDEVASGVKNKKEGENFFKIMDRREAIKKALENARAGDIVLVTGKGAEEKMMIGHEMVDWNDKKVIQEELQKLS
ncbi:MAG: UDP-N-acetylmuramoyl-L-alanyl-D-glutamate--2,6-diaminopimelate ligase [Candidatus Moranbacteria bacterium]|nr:UDP-N-acetylmuramoyl-L-alanyl-D-glutamate--2,6-diaminopimelate ligase [Candidatus Moranbacteria bacterium]